MHHLGRIKGKTMKDRNESFGESVDNLLVCSHSNSKLDFDGQSKTASFVGFWLVWKILSSFRQSSSHLVNLIFWQLFKVTEQISDKKQEFYANEWEFPLNPLTTWPKEEVFSYF